MKIIFIADYFVNEVLGGGELNNQEFLKILDNQNVNVSKIKSQNVTVDFINANSDAFFIVSNFILLSYDSFLALKGKNYIIYEHDHKYLSHRNPSRCKDFLCPKEDIINYEFYRGARAVLCQTRFHFDIIYKNLKIDNIVNLGGNLWSLESLQKMRQISKKQKRDVYSILDSSIAHKNTLKSVKYCESKGYAYELVKNNTYYTFLQELGKNSNFCFFPKTPETLSRVVVEARMMNMSVTTNKLVGATSEAWFSLKGEKLIDEMIYKREQITKTIMDLCYEK